MAALIHTTPARLRITHLWRKIHRTSVPVLMFHGVLPDADTSLFNPSGKFVSPERMQSFLGRIARMFRIVSMDEFISGTLNGRSPTNTMVLTIDDGYENVHRYAYPVLRGMGLPFTVFVSTGFVDTDRVLPWDILNYAVMGTDAALLPAGVLPRDVELGTPEAKRAALQLIKNHIRTESADRVVDSVDRICEALHVRSDAPDWSAVRFLSSAQIREMAGNGVTFGGHTVSHPVLSRESRDRVRTEVRECKRVLESITGRAVTVFAYPNGAAGDFNETTKEELRAAGYIASFATIHGLHHPGDDLFEIRRIGVDNRWTYDEFETRASGVLKALRR
jgi:peptidoglycan/xylan/chitin deacetylase (PgdA/CDA1 family)